MYYTYMYPIEHEIELFDLSRRRPLVYVSLDVYKWELSFFVQFLLDFVWILCFNLDDDEKKFCIENFLG